ncbi:hypothetical protein GPA10_26880 [Streptomyces sp. p1417]|uniref:DUF8017 domain-containing protein n=1 Tax=Streptomyces typhae TaxID=2681492 RepID=A0A6L6X3K8_9ACTN|nr:hypothetical protein [Streptomyces typhae]MVO88287.1 hypothetical protein [Streptomyces typhae]
MWPEQQPPGGEQNPQDPGANPYQQPGYQQPNPYQQPGYQQQPGYPQQQPAAQPNPYQQPPAAQPPAAPPGQPAAAQPQWGAPTFPMGAPQAGGPDGSGGGGNGDGRKTKITAIVAAAAVVVAAGVTGFLVLGDGDDKDGKSDKADSKPSKSVSKKPTSEPSSDDDNPRGTGGDPKPTIPGWQVVVNPKWGTAFDVPPDWTVKSPDTFIGFEEKKGDGTKPLIIMSAPAIYKEKWCSSDGNKDGKNSDTSLAAVGTKGQNGAKNTKDVARNDSAWWVFGGYTGQKKADKKKIKIGKTEPYTTESGIEGSVTTSTTSGVPKTDKCDSDGKATTFAFKNGSGDYVAWTLYGAKGVKEEVPDAQVKKILATVRLHGQPEES